MIKAIIILSSVIILLILLLVLLLSANSKLRKERNLYKHQSENLTASMTKIEENIANANKQKNEIHSGDDVTNFVNGLNILQNFSKKR